MSAPGVQKAMLDLMDALLEAVIRTEATADALVQAATELSNLPAAETIRQAARYEQVKALELRSRLAALRDEYAKRFPLEL